MTYFGGSRTQKRSILDKFREQLAKKKDQEYLRELDLDDWNAAFDRLNRMYWNGKLRKIPVSMQILKEKAYGIYYNSGRIHLNVKKQLTPQAWLGVLLHEMCHHAVHQKYGHGKTSSRGTRIIGHGKEWKTEMRRVGYTGKITKYTGKNRFIGSDISWK